MAKDVTSKRSDAGVPGPVPAAPGRPQAAAPPATAPPAAALRPAAPQAVTPQAAPPPTAAPQAAAPPKLAPQAAAPQTLAPQAAAAKAVAPQPAGKPAQPVAVQKPAAPQPAGTAAAPAQPQGQPRPVRAAEPVPLRPLDGRGQQGAGPAPPASGRPADAPRQQARPAGAGQQPAPARPAPEIVDTASAVDLQRRSARRRAAGPARAAVAANDDAPSIGALIYALNQKPSKQPFHIAAGASAFWFVVSTVLGWAMLSSELKQLAHFGEIFARPSVIVTIATIFVPIMLFWFLALLVWRAQELKLMSSAMTEVAVRLAEPDRMAEQAVASLGQNVRRQVTFMNDAVGRALGRAGELEALVHSEVASLERSYHDNEIRIRALIGELASERTALANSSRQVTATLRGIGSEVSREIVAASDSVTRRLGEATAGLSQKLEVQSQHSVNRVLQVTQQITRELQQSSNRTGELLSERGNAFLGQLSHIYARLGTEVPQLVGKLTAEQQRLTTIIDEAGKNLVQLQTALAERTDSLESSLGERTRHLQTVLLDYTQAADTALAERGRALDASITARIRSLDALFGERTQALDQSLEQRSEALGAAISGQVAAMQQLLDGRLRSFDETVVRSTIAVDAAVGEKARALTVAMESQAKALTDSLGKQATELDETLLQGINSVRRTSENITRQSIKTIEGLANQADHLRKVSENLLNQIYSVTSRFDHQGQAILQAANALEGANLRIDNVLSARQSDLDDLMGRLDVKTQDLDKLVRGYGQALDGQLKEAEQRARLLTEQLQQGTAAVIHGSLSEAESRARAVAEQLKQGTSAAIQGSFSEAEQRARQMAEQLKQGTAAAIHGPLSEAEARTRLMAEHLKQGTSAIEGTLSEAEHRARAVAEQFRQGTAAAFEGPLGEAEKRARQMAEHLKQGTSAFEGTLTEAEQRARQMAEQFRQGTAAAFEGPLSEAEKRARQMAAELKKGTTAALQSSLAEAEHRARTVAANLAREQEARQRQTLAELDRVKAETDARSERTLDELRSRFASVERQMASQLSDMSSRIGETSQQVVTRAAEAASELESAQTQIRQQADRLPAATRESAEAMRKALQDQLRALESLNAIANRQAAQRDVVPPDPPPPAAAQPTAAPIGPPTAAPAERPVPPALSQISHSLAREMGQRARPEPASPMMVPGPAAPPPAPPAPGAPAAAREGWRMNELLERASRDDGRDAAPPPPATSARTGLPIDIEAMAHAVDGVAALETWARLRTRQSPAVSPALLTPRGHTLYQEIAGRCLGDGAVRGHVHEFLEDFEASLRDLDQRDPSGQLAQGYLTSDFGKVYLLLACAVGRIA